MYYVMLVMPVSVLIYWVFFHKIRKRTPNVSSSSAIHALFPSKSLVPSSHQAQVHLRHKIILITGAAGSIGNELVKQIVLFQPKQLILIDQAESPLFDLLQDLAQTTTIQLTTYIADIADKNRIHAIFEQHKPQIVLHAAAYKHVPMMEQHPYEAIKTNIWGTKLLIDFSSQLGVEQFILISTDKAVEAQSIMGMSKRIAELYLLMQQKHVFSCHFSVIRFGNVIGSNGSVIPLFCKQIANGGPITVTHPACTRYFMSLTEACHLVFESLILGKGGDIFIFDMAEPVKILDLAKRLISLQGLRPYKDIPIIFVGLRAGERLHEQLWHEYETCEQTPHPAIFKVSASAPALACLYDFMEIVEKNLKNSPNFDWGVFLRTYFMSEIHPLKTQKKRENAV